MSSTLGERLKKIIRERKPTDIPNADTQKIIKIIENHSGDIEKYFLEHKFKTDVSSDDLDIETQNACCVDQNYWTSHVNYIKDYFKFRNFGLHVIYEHDIARKHYDDDDGYLQFTIFV